MWWMTEHPILFNLLGRGGGVFIPVSVYVARQNFLLLCVCVPVGSVVNSIYTTNSFLLGPHRSGLDIGIDGSMDRA